MKLIDEVKKEVQGIVTSVNKKYKSNFSIRFEK